MSSANDAIRKERRRIAREIHDVLGHHLTVIAIHAAATKGLGCASSDPVSAALELIRRSAIDAMQDLRRVLDSLETDRDSEASDRATLEQLDSLIDSIKGAGLDVEISLGGAPQPVDPEVSHTAMRIVQEALTNSLRHGHATDSRVALTYDGDSLTVEIIDNGLGQNSTSGSRVTHRGLLGMQQRVAHVCGDLQVGPVPAGGFRVWARLPRLVPLGVTQA